MGFSSVFCVFCFFFIIYFFCFGFCFFVVVFFVCFLFGLLFVLLFFVVLSFVCFFYLFVQIVMPFPDCSDCKVLCVQSPVVVLTDER